MDSMDHITLKLPCWKWLISHNAVNESFVNRILSNRVYVNDTGMKSLVNGHVLVQLLRSVNPNAFHSCVRRHENEGNHNNNNSQRWSVISEMLYDYDIMLDDDMMYLIRNGDVEVIVAVVEELFVKLSGDYEYDFEDISDDDDDNQYDSRPNIRQLQQQASEAAAMPLSPRDDDQRSSVMELEHALPSYDEYIPPTTHFESPRLPYGGGGGGGGGGGFNTQPQPLITLVGQLEISASRAWKLDAQTAKQYFCVEEKFQHLAEMFVHGHDGQGDFSPIVVWLHDVYQWSTPLSGYVLNNTECGEYVLSLLDTVVCSPNALVVNWGFQLCLQFIAGLALHKTPILFQKVWDHFTQSTTPRLANYTRASVGRIPCRNVLAKMLAHLAYGHVYELFVSKLPTMFDSFEHYLVFLHETLPTFLVTETHEHDTSMHRTASMMKHGVVGKLFEQCCTKLQGPTSVERRSAIVAFLSKWWCMFPTYFEDQPASAQFIVDSLGDLCRHHDLSTQITCLTHLFKLTDILAKQSSHYAAVCFKLTVFLLIENHLNEVIRDHILSNLCISLQNSDNMPIQIMIEPLVKQYALHGCSNIDFNFFHVVIQHPALQSRHAIILAHLLGKMSLNDVVFARMAARAFVSLAHRFADQPSMQDYMERYVRVALSLYLKATSARRSLPPNMQHAYVYPEKNHVTVTLALEVVAQLIHLRHKALCERFLPLLRSCIDEHVRLYGEPPRTLSSLADSAHATTTVHKQSSVQEVLLPQFDTQKRKSDNARSRKRSLRVDIPTPTNIEVSGGVTSDHVEPPRNQLLPPITRTNPKRASPKRSVKGKTKIPSPARPRGRVRKVPGESPSPSKRRSSSLSPTTNSQRQRQRTSVKHNTRTANARTPRRSPQRTPTSVVDLKHQKRGVHRRRRRTLPADTENDQMQQRAQADIDRIKQQREAKLKKQLHEENAALTRQVELKRKLARKRSVNAQRAQVGGVKMRSKGPPVRSIEDHLSKSQRSPVPPPRSPLAPDLQQVWREYSRGMRRLFETYAGKSAPSGTSTSFTSLQKQKGMMNENDFVMLAHDIDWYPTVFSKKQLASAFRKHHNRQLFCDYRAFVCCVVDLSQIAPNLSMQVDTPTPENLDAFCKMTRERCITLNVGPRSMWKVRSNVNKKIMSSEDVARAIISHIIARATGTQPSPVSPSVISKNTPKRSKGRQRARPAAIQKSITSPKTKRAPHPPQPPSRQKSVDLVQRNADLKRRLADYRKKKEAEERRVQEEAEKKAKQQRELKAKARERQRAEREKQKKIVEAYKKKREEQAAEKAALELKQAELEKAQRRKQVELYKKTKRERQRIAREAEQKRQAFLAKLTSEAVEVGKAQSKESIVPVTNDDQSPAKVNEHEVTPDSQETVVKEEVATPTSSDSKKEEEVNSQPTTEDDEELQQQQQPQQVVENNPKPKVEAPSLPPQQKVEELDDQPIIKNSESMSA